MEMNRINLVIAALAVSFFSAPLMQAKVNQKDESTMEMPTAEEVAIGAAIVGGTTASVYVLAQKYPEVVKKLMGRSTPSRFNVTGSINNSVEFVGDHKTEAFWTLGGLMLVGALIKGRTTIKGLMFKDDDTRSSDLRKLYNKVSANYNVETTKRKHTKKELTTLEKEILALQKTIISEKGLIKKRGSLDDNMATALEAWVKVMTNLIEKSK